MKKKLFYILQAVLGIIFLYVFFSPKREIAFGGQPDVQNHIREIIFVIFFLILVLAQILFHQISKAKMQQEMNVKNMLLEEQKKYYELLLQREESTKQFRHDWRNQLICISELLRQADYEKGQAYISEYLQETEKIQYVLNTGNTIINILVNDVCQRFMVNVHLTGIFPANVKIVDMDLCTLFSNLFSNAAEATKKAGKTFFSMRIKTEKSMLLIEIINAIEENAVVRNGRFQSTKTDDCRMHGIGMKNVQQIVDKYHGKIQYIQDGNEMTVKLILRNR